MRWYVDSLEYLRALLQIYRCNIATLVSDDKQLTILTITLLGNAAGIGVYLAVRRKALLAGAFLCIEFRYKISQRGCCMERKATANVTRHHAHLYVLLDGDSGRHDDSECSG